MAFNVIVLTVLILIVAGLVNSYLYDASVRTAAAGLESKLEDHLRQLVDKHEMWVGTPELACERYPAQKGDSGVEQVKTTCIATVEEVLDTTTTVGMMPQERDNGSVGTEDDGLVSKLEVNLTRYLALKELWASTPELSCNEQLQWAVARVITTCVVTVEETVDITTTVGMIPRR
jgi:hypothetical protein